MGLAQGRPQQAQETQVNKAAAYSTGVIAALLDAGLLKSADANALAERLRQEPDEGKRPGPPKKQITVPDYENNDVSWSAKGSVANSLLQNLGVEMRGPDETYE